MKRLLALLLGAVALAACTRVGTTGEGQRTNPKTIPHFLRYGDLGDLSSLNPLLVSDETLAHRHAAMEGKGAAAWKPAAPRKRNVTTALRAYAAFATSAARGAVREVP